MMAEPGDHSAAPASGHGRLRASHTDRERAIDVLKTAFVEDRLTKDEFDLRVGQVLASRTYAELGAVTSDLPAWQATAGPAAAGPPSTPARTLAKAALRSGGCVLVAFAMVAVVALTNSESLAGLAFFPVVAAVIAASGFLGYGVVDAWQERRSRGKLPPRLHNHPHRLPGLRCLGSLGVCPGAGHDGSSAATDVGGGAGYAAAAAKQRGGDGRAVPAHRAARRPLPGHPPGAAEPGRPARAPGHRP